MMLAEPEPSQSGSVTADVARSRTERKTIPPLRRRT
jgi:hypothetical protein